MAKIQGTPGNDRLMGTVDKDDIKGGAGDDYIDGLDGADNYTGGEGADTFKIHSWAWSRDWPNERKRILDFQPNDKIDLQNLSRYYIDNTGTRQVRDLVIEDILFEPIKGGNILHINIWEGDAQFDVGIVVRGAAPTIANFIFSPI